MAAVLRGDVFWADLDPAPGREPSGLRPVVLVLSQELFNRRSGTVIAMAITSQPSSAGFPVTLPVSSGRLHKESWIKISQIRTIPVERLGRKIARLEEEQLNQVVDGLLELIT